MLDSPSAWAAVAVTCQGCSMKHRRHRCSLSLSLPTSFLNPLCNWICSRLFSISQFYCFRGSFLLVASSSADVSVKTKCVMLHFCLSLFDRSGARLLKAISGRLWTSKHLITELSELQRCALRYLKIDIWYKPFVTSALPTFLSRNPLYETMRINTEGFALCQASWAYYWNVRISGRRT